MALFRSNAWNRFRYTLWAPVYDVVLRLARPMRRRAMELVNVAVGERVLIVGAGTGLDLDYLPRDARIAGTDLTGAMLRKLRGRAGRLGMSNVTAVQADAQRLGFADSSFDVVILHFIVAVAPDPFATMREAARVLRIGGRAVVLDKFAADDGDVPPMLKMLNPLASALVTEVTRKLRPIVESAPLRIVHVEPLAMRGFFKVALLEKSRDA